MPQYGAENDGKNIVGLEDDKSGLRWTSGYAYVVGHEDKHQEERKEDGQTVHQGS